MNSLSFDPGAIRDLRESFAWYSKGSLERAGRFLDSFERGCEKIVAHPRRFPRFSRNTRRLVLQDFPFSIVYRELAVGVQVIAVAHAKRRADYWKNRS